jgi:hypothetical protein
MIRFGRLMMLAFLVAAAYGLYLVKWEVRELKRDNILLEAKILQEERAIRILEAEWAYLNRPDRLKKLVEKHLPLQPTIGEQIAELDHLYRPAPLETLDADSPQDAMRQLTGGLSREGVTR